MKHKAKHEETIADLRAMAEDFRPFAHLPTVPEVRQGMLECANTLEALHRCEAERLADLQCLAGQSWLVMYGPVLDDLRYGVENR